MADDEAKHPLSPNGANPPPEFKDLELHADDTKPSIAAPSQQQVQQNLNDDDHQAQVMPPRMFNVNDPSANAQYRFCKNVVKTSRYSLITFIPVNLFEQFRRLANFYFLVCVLLQIIPNVSPFPIWTIALPLAFILAITAIKEAYEDIIRHREDSKQNNKICYKVGNDGKIEPIRSRNIQVGDVLRVHKGEFFPCDVILLASSNHDNSCYVNTAELDGETAPKAKRSPRIGIDGSANTAPEILSKLIGKVTATSPVARFDGFEGKLEAKVNGIEAVVGIGDGQLCLKGSKVDNTQFIYGLVYATGKDTKLMLNRLPTSFKFSSFERRLNKGVLFSFGLQIIINIIFASVNTSTTTFTQLQRSNASNWGYEFATSFILFSYFIPLSLYVTLEFTRVGQGLIIEGDQELSVVEFEVKQKDDADVKLADEVADPNQAKDAEAEMSRRLQSFNSSFALVEQRVPIRKKAKVKTTDINDELGMVEFIMTDKTGTLTKNKMELKACFVDGIEFINTDLFPDLMAAEEQFGGAGNSASIGVSKVDSLESLVKSVWGSGAANDDGNSEFISASISKDRELSYFQDFLLCVLLCNDVLVTKNRNDPNQKKYVFQSLSPDEVAFVEALDSNGITLIQSNDVEKEVLLDNGNIQQVKLKFKVHGSLGFTADRKRMSVVVEDSKGMVKLLTKGADSKIAQLLEHEIVNETMLKRNDVYLNHFANDGNRTLVFASRTLDEETFRQWQNAYQAAAISIEHREPKIEASFGLIEKDMKLLGCTAVEDPLQDGVPQAIDLLLHAGIVVVVLTGDKQETAVAIAKSANIVQPDASLHFINSVDTAQIGSALQKLYVDIQELKGHHALVIHGDALELAIRKQRSAFLAVLPLLQTIVCSRATPSQKAGMVTLGRFELKKVCLAIGDGANDVSMIQKADVGVGLTGKEGTQAAQSADFVLHRFRHLPRLLFVHGRFSYIRMCKVVYWSFYKNTLFPFPLVFYGIFSSWSDMPMYDSIIMNAFNIVFTSLPPLLIGWTEKDQAEDVLMATPRTYTWYRDTQKFSVETFIKWVTFGVFQSLILFWVAFGIFYNVEVISSDGRQAGVYVFGQWIATAAIIVVNITFLTEAMNWTRGLILFTVLGPVVYLFGYLAFGNSLSYVPNLYGINKYMFEVVMSYLYQLISVTLCVLPVHFRNYVRAKWRTVL
eukprot:TRINITY_DN2330_c0_g1_i1.p1 TRINITY_DN2330_c0_g1~~TRINITY_DN2330_c0_g1_i1.p1  ORF type:complete len:1197 (-),score=323.51 TRINITY_DN2330_c0_g1_i1:49-3603(-)